MDPVKTDSILNFTFSDFLRLSSSSPWGTRNWCCMQDNSTFIVHWKFHNLDIFFVLFVFLFIRHVMVEKFNYLGRVCSFPSPCSFLTASEKTSIFSGFRTWSRSVHVFVLKSLHKPTSFLCKLHIRMWWWNWRILGAQCDLMVKHSGW